MRHGQILPPSAFFGQFSFQLVYALPGFLQSLALIRQILVFALIHFLHQIQRIIQVTQHLLQVFLFAHYTVIVLLGLIQSGRQTSREQQGLGMGKRLL